MRHTFVLRSERVMENAVDAVIKAAKGEDLYAGKTWRVTIEPEKKRRTLPQNSTLHMWINEIAEHVGDSPEAIKKWLKDDYWPKHTILRMGRMRTEPKSTADLSLEEMMTVMEHIQALCSNFGIPLTQPIP